MTARVPQSMILELFPGAEPIAGRLGQRGHESRGFAGYLELIALLEEIRVGAAPLPEEGPRCGGLPLMDTNPSGERT